MNRTRGRVKLRLPLAFCLAGFLPFATALHGQSDAPAVAASGTIESLAGKLPGALREQGLTLANEPNEKSRAKLADAIARKNADGAREFLLSVLEKEPSPLVRRAILDRLARAPNDAVMEALARHAATDPDAELAIFALDRYRYERMWEVRKLLDRRISLSPQIDNAVAAKMLGREDERWISLMRGTMLPTFLQDPPPLFNLKPANGSIRVLAFGDFGNGTKNQRNVAMAMQRYHANSKFDFGITLGDNFYSKGMLSTRDPHWKSWWDEMYDPLAIQIYASLGNHDWGYADSPAAEVLYSYHSSTWRMPATYYTFIAGPVQFFALDTNEISRAQLSWLDEEIGKSTARWKVVYGHHPIYSAGTHSDNPTLIKQLLPVLRDRVDVYLAGHDHDMQHLKSEGGVHLFVAGGAGAGLRVPKPTERTIFARDMHGFSVLDVTPQAFQIRFIGTDLNEAYRFTINK